MLLVSYNYIIGTSIKSSTDYASTHIQNSVNNVNEYEVLTDTKIYYGCPQFHYNRLFPYFSPIKYSTKTFKKGDSVIAVDSSITLEDDRYIEVTNGNLTGYVNKKISLKKKRLIIPGFLKLHMIMQICTKQLLRNGQISLEITIII